MEKQKTLSQTNEYKAETIKRLYDKTVVYLPKGQLDVLKQKAKEQNMSVNAYINAAIESYK